MELIYRKGPLRFIEVWFNKAIPDDDWQMRYRKVDVIVFHESHVPVTSNSIPFRHGIIELDRDLERLFRMLNSGFRNEVRRAGKEGIVIEPCSRIDNIDSVFDTYASFCRSKSIGVLPYFLLQRYARTGSLFVSKATLGHIALQAHLYMATSTEAILLASFPLCYEVPSKVIGWANRALHWADMVHFKEAGLLRYNLGGMGNPVTDQNRAIVAFKNEMCPTVTVYYQDLVTVSRLGDFYSYLKKLTR